MKRKFKKFKFNRQVAKRLKALNRREPLNAERLINHYRKEVSS